MDSVYQFVSMVTFSTFLRAGLYEVPSQRLAVAAGGSISGSAPNVSSTGSTKCTCCFAVDERGFHRAGSRARRRPMVPNRDRQRSPDDRRTHRSHEPRVRPLNPVSMLHYSARAMDLAT